MPAQAPEHVLFDAESPRNRYSVRPFESTRIVPSSPSFAAPILACCALAVVAGGVCGRGAIATGATAHGGQRAERHRGGAGGERDGSGASHTGSFSFAWKGVTAPPLLRRGRSAREAALGLRLCGPG